LVMFSRFNHSRLGFFLHTQRVLRKLTQTSVITVFPERFRKSMNYSGYITVQKKNIHITEKAKTLCEIIKNDEITNADMTAKWEKYLKKIRNEAGTQEVFLKSITNFILHLIETVPNTFSNSKIKKHVRKIDTRPAIGTCPKCQNNIIEKGKFYGCSNYPTCKFTLPNDFRKKKLTKKNIKELLEGKETLVKSIKKADKKTYNANIKLNDSGYLSFVSFEK